MRALAQRAVLTAALGVLSLLVTAPGALAGSILFQRANEIWVMGEDGSNPRVLTGLADLPPGLGSEQIASLSRPAMDEASGTLLFAGNVGFDAVNGIGVYKRETNGAVTRLSRAVDSEFNGHHSTDEQPEPFGDGRFIFREQVCHNEDGTTCRVTQLTTQSLADTPADGDLETRDHFESACDGSAVLHSPSPNPVNPAQVAYVGCPGLNQRRRLIVAEDGRVNETIVIEDEGSLFTPAWRPDGGQIAAVELGDAAGIYVYDPDDGIAEKRRVFDMGSQLVANPTYMRNGTILFDFGAGGQRRIYSIPTTCNSCTIDQATPLTDGVDREPEWTPRDFPLHGLAHVVDGELRFTATPGDEDNVDVFPDFDGAGGVLLQDLAGVQPGAGCERVTDGGDPVPERVVCHGVDTAKVDLGDQDDLLVGWGTLPLVGQGGPGNDTLIGSDGPDDLRGGTGADAINGYLGTDTMNGDEGTDLLSYIDRTDPVAIRLDGRRNDGADPNRNGSSAATEENDQDRNFEQALGGEGADRLYGSVAVNALTGGGGDDTLDGGPGGDTLDGGDGFDRISYETRGAGEPVVVKLDNRRNDGADPDANRTSSTAEEGDLDRSIEHATGGAGADAFFGSGAANSLLGGAGDDLFDGGLGADSFDGGPGIDTLSYATRTAGVAVRLDGKRNDGADDDGSGASSAAEEGDLDRAIENATGGSGPDLLRSVLADGSVLIGNNGADELYARDGTGTPDQLKCGSGADSAQFDPADVRTSCETRIP